MSVLLSFLMGPIGRFLIVGAMAAAAGFGAAWHFQGGRLDKVKAEYTQFQASVKAAQEVHAAEDKRKEAESTNVILQKEAENVKTAKVVSDAWAAYSNGLRRAADSRPTSQGSKPTGPVTSIVCNDPAKDAQLSAAIERARQEIGSAVTEYRLGVAQLFEQADKQAEQLITLQAEVQEVARVNQ